MSKSRFTTGLQCVRQLWWRVHEPDAAELVPDPVLRARFDTGHVVGRAAQDHLPGGVLIELDRGRFKEAIAATKAALGNGASRIYEACFSEGGVFVAVDVLERRSKGWGIVEVKSTTKAKDVHIPDAAVQAWVLTKAGLDIRRIEVMHLNRSCVNPDLSNLFRRQDVTGAARSWLPSIPAEIRRQRAVLEGRVPDVAVGPHCDEPYECPFKARCHPDLPSFHVTTLYRGKRRAATLLSDGIETIADIPDRVRLTPVQTRQRRAVLAGEATIEPNLDRTLAAFQPPFGYLDFETIAPAIPAWCGCRPYDTVPVQFAAYGPGPSGRLRFREWLATGAEDPRPALAESLVDATASARTVFAYYASFERRCIQHLADAVPSLREPLLELRDKLADLLPVVREHVYHPDFDGHFGLKAVLPALVPSLAYSDLEVAGGDVAAAELERLILNESEYTALERRTLRRDLLAYCKRDTWGLVKLHRWLQARA